MPSVDAWAAQGGSRWKDEPALLQEEGKTCLWTCGSAVVATEKGKGGATALSAPLILHMRE